MKVPGMGGEGNEEKRPDDAGRGGRGLSGIDAVVTVGEALSQCKVDVGIVEAVGEDTGVAMADGKEEGERDREVEGHAGEGNGRRSTSPRRSLGWDLILANAVHRRTIPFSSRQHIVGSTGTCLPYGFSGDYIEFTSVPCARPSLDRITRLQESPI